MVIKVKEPQPDEYPLLREEQILFTFLHLAAAPELTQVLLKKKITAVAYETVQLDDGSLPLLTPMSQVAGRLAVQIGAHLLEKPSGGMGILPGGVPGVPPAEVLIIGGGIVGTNSAQMAVGLGASVTVIDIDFNRLCYFDTHFGPRVKTIISNDYNIANKVRQTDLLIGAVLVMGGKCPHLVTEQMVKTMKPGSVIVDVAIDQGGTIETVDHATTHADPTYLKHGVIHYSVANIPAMVPKTSTMALTSVTMPYINCLADNGLEKAARLNTPLARGVNTMAGLCRQRQVAQALKLDCTPLVF